MKKKTGKIARSAALLLALVLLSGSARPVCVRAMLTEEEQIANKKKKEKKIQTGAQTQQTEAKATEAQQAETKAADAQTGAKATEAQQAETKAADAQTGAKATEAQQAETKAADAQQTGAKATEAQQAETKAADAQTETEAQTEAPQTQTETETETSDASAVREPVGAADGPLVVIDPGHQAPGSELTGTEPNGPGSETEKDKTAPGAKGTDTGVEEYELNLDVSLQLEQELIGRGYRVLLTRREHNVSLSNIDRCEIANEAGADILLHIHANTLDDASASGAVGTVPSQTNPYISELYESCTALSDDILRAYCKATGLKNNGSWRSDNLAAINWSKSPVAILELGYLTNPEDEAYITDPGNLETMAKAIADGIDEYFGR